LTLLSGACYHPRVSTSPALPPDTEPLDDAAAADLLAQGCQALRQEIGKVIVGHAEVIEQLLIALLADGHCLFVGVPGLGKTLLVRTLARCLDLHFSRIQFTPDLMPADITGTDIIQIDPATGDRNYRFVTGPVFANVVLADEINRTPPKTQSALLQAMQERHVTSGGQTLPLPLPFFVLATQNPIEQEGTYPLPEAQLDRFMLGVHLAYPSEAEEQRMVAATTSTGEPKVNRVLTGAQVQRLQQVVRGVPVSQDALAYAVRLARATRPGTAEAPGFIGEWVTWGAGPRASQALVLGAKARALMQGRFAASRDDVAALALPVLRHRVIPSFGAEADGISTEQIVTRLLESVPRG
jgi:MoxR-like ATPase